MRHPNNSPPARPGQLLPSDRLILSYLQRLARWYGPAVFASVAMIAHRCGLSERTVQRGLPRLATAGVIGIEPDPSNATGRKFLIPTGQPASQGAREQRDNVGITHIFPAHEQNKNTAKNGIFPAQVKPVPCHPKGQGASVSPYSLTSVREGKKSSEARAKAPAKVTTSLLSEADRAVLEWFLDRRQRAGKIGNAGAYLFSVGRQWASDGIPADIAGAYAAWERARASRVAQEQRREQERIERLASGPEPPQPELGAMIRAMLPMRFRASLEAQEPLDGGNRRIIQGHGAIQAAVNVPC